MKILAVIPARGGSKGIPKKNIRLLNGKPLIMYAIQNALNCELIDDVVVTTDSEEIAYISKKSGADVIMRDVNLAGDLVTLDPVIYDAVLRIEKINNCIYDYVVTMQATSPLLKSKSLEEALDYSIKNNYDSVLSAINKPHLAWKEDNGRIFPDYAKRLNRQELPPYYVEAGAFVISKRIGITEKSRIYGKIAVFPIPANEAIDIDDREDWVVCESILRKKKILFRMDGYDKLGMGHVYNCITLAYSMMEHDVLLVISDKSYEGIKKVKETNLPYKIINDKVTKRVD